MTSRGLLASFFIINFLFLFKLFHLNFLAILDPVSLQDDPPESKSQEKLNKCHWIPNCFVLESTDENKIAAHGYVYKPVGYKAVDSHFVLEAKCFDSTLEDPLSEIGDDSKTNDRHDIVAHDPHFFIWSQKINNLISDKPVKSNHNKYDPQWNNFISLIILFSLWDITLTNLPTNYRLARVY